MLVFRFYQTRDSKQLAEHDWTARFDGNMVGVEAPIQLIGGIQIGAA